MVQCSAVSAPASPITTQSHKHHIALSFVRGLVQCRESIEVISYKIGVCRVAKAGGKECHTEFQRLSFNGVSSVVLCRPYTGRMHQIRVHLQYLGESFLFCRQN